MSSGLHLHLLKSSLCSGRHEHACDGAKATWPRLMPACHQAVLRAHAHYSVLPEARQLSTVSSESQF
jgi:hypothetical protein